MRIQDMLEIKRKKKAGEITGRKTPIIKPKPGQHIVDGELRYDGTGPSGYTGPVNTTKRRKV